ncbi:hypothetical protein HK097_010350 [Rhizophlyctis rosea]|uniref:Uncharacterized protein n=1 Tax=Rhizophlyctis rosea TaxID=64517 RepID=A0AAD5SIY3_9FUNG|nr:hypothetical protein HK097_010350 [Rhizophlyctis rosea]
MYPSTTLSQVLIYLTIAVFFSIGVWAGLRKKQSKDTWLTARNTQGWLSLGTNFFAAGLGVWTVFAIPEVGTGLGLIGTVDYAIACILPLFALCYMGPLLRRKAPNGVTITQFVHTRFGWAAQLVTNLTTLFYMGIYLISELTALAFLLETYGIDPLWPQIVVCSATIIYTSIGGMPASLITDKFQGWIVMLLMIIAVVAISTTIRLPSNFDAIPRLIPPTTEGWQSLYTLPIAVTAANMFHQGYWQRVYSARSNRDLYLGVAFASSILFPVMLAFGIGGMVAVWSGLSEKNNSIAFFNIMEVLPSWANGFVLVLAVALVASSTDTLQSGLAATITTDIFMNKLSLIWARVGAALINIPAVVLALRGYSVLQLFLIADLIAAVVVVPVILGLVTRLNGTLNGFDFVVSVVGGFVSVVGFGWVFEGSFEYGIKLLGLPNGLSKSGESIGAFVAAPLGALVFMFLSSFIRRPIMKAMGWNTVGYQEPVAQHDELTTAVNSEERPADVENKTAIVANNTQSHAGPSH